MTRAIAIVASAYAFSAPAALADEAGNTERKLAAVQTALVAPPRPAQKPISQSPVKDTDDQITIVIGGDLGLGGSNQPVHPGGAMRHGKRHDVARMTEHIAPLINGDLNFANLETVVTDSNTLKPWSKAFNFRSHPAGIRQLVELGFNVFSTANNHAVDYGTAGLTQTMLHLAAMRADGLLGFPGLGNTRTEAGAPAQINVKGSNILVSAVGIGGIAPKAGRPGMLSFRSRADLRDATERLAGTAGAYRIMSVHYGLELGIRPSSQNVKRLRDEVVREAGVDLVVGHHAHVAAGVQQVDGKLIFYGLGNLLHPGMQDMAKFDACRDYGLMAKLHVSRKDSGKLVARAIEVWPLQDMHVKAKPMTGAKARRRISILNGLAKGLDDKKTGATGIRFQSRADGSGLACLEGSSHAGGAIGRLCRNWHPPKHAAGSTKGCSSDSTVIARKRAKRGYASHAKRRAYRAARARPYGSGNSFARQIFGF